MVLLEGGISVDMSEGRIMLPPELVPNARDLETGHGVTPYQEHKRGPLPHAVPDMPRPDAGLSFMQALLGFVLGCILVLAVAGCFEFRRAALAATASADSFELRVSVLESHVETLKAWNDSFTYELGELQKHFDAAMALGAASQQRQIADAAKINPRIP
jgi:hypothetical protein